MGVEVVWAKLGTWERCGGLPRRELLLLLQEARGKKNLFLKDKYRFLVLGLDQRQDELEQTMLTDTIMLVSFDRGKREVKLVSLPRDWWSEEWETKINAFWFYAQQEDDRWEWFKARMGEVLGTEVDGVLVLDQEFLVGLVGAVGGVEVNLSEGFIDEEYPNPDYVASPGAEVEMYKRVEFRAGENFLDGEQVLEFVRSRKGSDLAEGGGTDLGRATRQQLLVEAFLKKFMGEGLWRQPCVLGELYELWRRGVESDWSESDWVALGWGLWPKFGFSLLRTDLPVGEEGLLYHPVMGVKGQWVWLPKDQVVVESFFKEI